MFCEIEQRIEYTETFARRLDTVSPLRVREAEDGMALAAGEVAVGRGGVHLRIVRRSEDLVARLDPEPHDARHRPSVDTLFESAARALGDATLGVVPSGMGDDGLVGARVLRAAGGRILTEAEESCVVYGMTRVVHEAGLSEAQVPLQDMAAAIMARL